MGQVLHGSAKTTHAIRAELQRSQASVAILAKRYGINEKTVLKWRSTVLSPMEEAAIVALRVQARLPLDDVYIALKDVFRTGRAQACTAVCNDMASRACRRQIAKSPNNSRNTRSTTSTSTSPISL